MAKGRIDVVGIGNAIVDVLSHSDISLLTRHQLTKGAMTLLDERKAETMYRDMAGGVEVSGGSAANTVAALAALGSRATFIGKVRDDDLGEVFTNDIRSVGVRFDTAPASNGPSTARCLIVVTPDAKRTMGTYLGACVELGPDDIDVAEVHDATAFGELHQTEALGFCPIGEGGPFVVHMRVCASCSSSPTSSGQVTA